MILGELIGLIALPVMWILFVISIYGIRYELNNYKDRPIFDFIYAFLFSFSFVIGLGLLIWFFVFTGLGGLGESIGLFLNNLWTTKL